jgi:TPR repeat protein
MLKFLMRLVIVAVATSCVAFVAQAATEQAAPQWSDGEKLYRQGNYPEAMSWWTERAAQGDIESARRLGIEYMDGKYGVVQRDPVKARQYHMQAALGGERRSLMDLGTIHESGFGVPADLVEAARWFEWSAKYGFAPAQNNIATLLETGEGGRKDEIEAYKYYVLAALDAAATLKLEKPDLDMPPADSGMGQLARRLTPAQRAEARDRAKKFVPLKGPLPASENR